MAQTVKPLSTIRESRVRALGWEDPLEKDIAIHSSTIAWKIPRTEEPGSLQSMGRKESDTNEQPCWGPAPADPGYLKGSRRRRLFNIN